jgi:hypothetical protein
MRKEGRVRSSNNSVLFAKSDPMSYSNYVAPEKADGEMAFSVEHESPELGTVAVSITFDAS